LFLRNFLQPHDREGFFIKLVKNNLGHQSGIADELEKLRHSFFESYKGGVGRNLFQVILAINIIV